MRCFWLVARFLLLSHLLFVVIPACQAFRPLVVLVRDGDTKKPIAGAGVRLSYPLDHAFLAPGESSEVTGIDGVVRLKAWSDADARPMLEVAVGGYLDYGHFLPLETVRAIPPAHMFENVGHRPVGVVVELYADHPVPTVDFVLPASYRGLVTAEIKVPDDAVSVPGQRNFVFAVPDSGTVRITGPALLGRFALPKFSARYADGRALSSEVTADQIGFWEVKTESGTHTFLVGTQAEYERYRADHPMTTGGGERAESGQGGGKRGGHGRGRHGGGDPSADGP